MLGATFVFASQAGDVVYGLESKRVHFKCLNAIG